MRPQGRIGFALLVIAGWGAFASVVLMVMAVSQEPAPVFPISAIILLVFSGVVALVGVVQRVKEHTGATAGSAPGGHYTASPGSVRTGTGANGQSTVKQPPLTFADVAGLDEAIADLRELVSYIRDRDRYQAVDAKLPRGVLLYGPPGTGKTLIAKVLAAEAGASFFYASGSSFVEKYVGVGALRIRELFVRVRQQAPAVLFIDEVDSIGRTRGQSESTEWDTSLNQLLTELDGFDSVENLLLICATNRRELLDEALLRPGRLDRQIFIGLPDLPARTAILHVHTRHKPLALDINLETIARRTPGLSGAHLAAVANEAALAAVRSGRQQLTMADFDLALDAVLAGHTGRAHILTPVERRLVAYHEAGHALVGTALGQGIVEKITLLSRSQALGYVLQVPEEQALHSRADLNARIAVLLAGQAAEELLTGDFTTGAVDDLKKATSIAERMVTEYGMGAGRPHQVIREQSLVLSEEVAADVTAMIGHAWERARSLVRQYQPALERLAEALIERESLDRDQVADLLADVAGAPAASAKRLPPHPTAANY